MRNAITECVFFNDTATTEIYTLSLHDALPISSMKIGMMTKRSGRCRPPTSGSLKTTTSPGRHGSRSEEHTSELQSRQYLVCRLLLEKKKQSLPSHVELHPFLYSSISHIDLHSF